MNICFVINTLDVGGAAKMLKFVSNTMQSAGHKVEVVSLFKSQQKQDGLNDSILLHNLQVPSAGMSGRIDAVKRLRFFLSRHRGYNIICSFISDVAFTTRLATLGMKDVKVVSAERGDPYTLKFPWSLFTKWTYRYSDYCFFQLPNARDFYGRKTREHSFVIPNVFIPQELLEPHTGARNKTIVSAGRFAQEKRFEVLIEAFSIVKAKHPEYSLTIYGEGSYLEIYKQLVSSLGLSDVSFPGYVNNVAKAIQHDGIFVLSSLYEGIPNSLIEALSVGIPCVSTDCTPGGPRYLTKNGTTGIIVPVNDVCAMANAILRIIESPDLARELEQSGPSILAELDRTKIEKMWIDAFEQIINE